MHLSDIKPKDVTALEELADNLAAVIVKLLIANLKLDHKDPPFEANSLLAAAIRSPSTESPGLIQSLSQESQTSLILLSKEKIENCLEDDPCVDNHNLDDLVIFE